MTEADPSHFSAPGIEIAVRVTPRAARNAVSMDAAGRLRVHVTVVPEDGKANASVVKLLSRALRVPKARLELVRCATARDKLFRVL